MKSKLKNPILLWILYWGALWADTRFAVLFNRFLQAVQKKFFIPWLESQLTLYFRRDGMQLIPRHSVLDLSGYNLFLSDIDFNLVFEKLPSTDELQQVLLYYHDYAKRFPFLGELEIYDKNEATLKNLLIQKYEPLLSFIWKLRKWSWQSDLLKSAGSRYHQLKARRSIRRLRIQLGAKEETLSPDLSRLSAVAMNRFFPEVHSTIPMPLLPAYSYYLGWTLEKVDPRLIALLPDGEHLTNDHFSEIKRLRAYPDLGAAFGAVAAWELLLHRAHARWINQGVDRAWEKHLQITINDYAPRLLDGISFDASFRKPIPQPQLMA